MTEAESSAKKPVWKRGWFIVLAIIVAGSIGAAVSGDQDKTATPSGNGSEASSDRRSGLRDPVREGQFEFVVSKVDCGDTRVGDSTFGDKAQGQYCFVHLSVENIGDEAQSFFGSDQYLYDRDGRRFSADDEAQIYLDEGNAIYEEINPGNTVRGIVVFDIPKPRARHGSNCMTPRSAAAWTPTSRPASRAALPASLLPGSRRRRSEPAHRRPPGLWFPPWSQATPDGAASGLMARTSS